MSGLLAPTVRETMPAARPSRRSSKFQRAGTGCRVTTGGERGASVRLIRDSVVVHARAASRGLKDDAREVITGQECGMAFENYQT
jgi:translation initiation factor IF-2